MTTIRDIRLDDFWAALGEEFSQAICPPVAFEVASPQECCEPLREVLGSGVTPLVLAALTETDLHRLAEAFGANFDVPPPSLERLKDAVDGTLARWPASEWPREP